MNINQKMILTCPSGYSVISYLFGQIMPRNRKSYIKASQNPKLFFIRQSCPSYIMKEPVHGSAPLNFKDRVFLSDVFGDYIPSFHYLVVPLNKYSKQDLIEKNDELSLIFLINQLQNSSEFHALKDIPKEYTEHLTENTPDYLLKIIGK